MIGDGPWRQFGNDLGIRFGATEHERPDHPGQPGMRIGITVALDWLDDRLFETARRAEQSARSLIADRPEFAQMVLDWGSRQSKPNLGSELSHGSCCCRGPVLHRLGLVRDHQTPFQL